MSEVKKIATRESYGKALVELGGEHSNLVVLDSPPPPKPACSARRFRIAILTAALRRRT